jgi:hypothetical protein
MFVPVAVTRVRGAAIGWNEDEAHGSIMAVSDRTQHNERGNSTGRGQALPSNRKHAPPSHVACGFVVKIDNSEK